MQDRIPLVKLDHDNAYNFWQDKAHVRGIWRVTSIADYASAASRTGRPCWTWTDWMPTRRRPSSGRAPTAYDAGRCLVRLSPGGGDATTVREFDLKTRGFVKDGFALPQSKLTAD